MLNRLPIPTTARLMLIVPLLAAAGCAGGEQVTPQAIARSRKAWEAANIRDYDLEWTTTAPRNTRYLVTVRAGKVKRVDLILPDKRAVEMHPGQPRAYGVDGLFQ